jgi:ABC-type transport system involved in cytochrome c biogenesis permease component
VWDALVDANPVLARELLVTARTPVYAKSVILAPLLLGALVVMVWMGTRFDHGPRAGRDLFPVYYIGLGVLVACVGSMLGSAVIVQEREAGALDALKFCSLSPRRIVFGKFAAVVLAETAVIVCTLPLLALVLATGGVSLGQAVWAMAIVAACGLMTASLGIGVSCHATNTRRAGLLSLLATFAIGIGVWSWLAATYDLSRWHPGSGRWSVYGDPPIAAYVALLCVVPVYAVSAVVGLGGALARSGLMDASEDGGRPLQQWMLWAWPAGAFALASGANATEYVRTFMLVTSSVVIALLGVLLVFFFTGRPAQLTRRMQAHEAAGIGRLLPRRLAPSVLFAVAATGVGWLLAPVLLGEASDMTELYALWAALALSTWGGFMGCIAARWGAPLARQLGVLVGTLLPLGVLVLRSGLAANPVDAIFPLWLGFRGHFETVGTPETLQFACVLWGIAALGFVAGMFYVTRARATSGQ